MTYPEQTQLLIAKTDDTKGRELANIDDQPWSTDHPAQKVSRGPREFSRFGAKPGANPGIANDDDVACTD